jgi:Zn-dependent M16 (insulinase) family peptidase
MIHGFHQEKEKHIRELKTLARFYLHAKTGAQLLFLSNDNENKVFGIAFRTPPSDSTGVAHILEHSVLCGSRKYPVKEPFVELLKGSLQTFLNAFTYPDKTCYPVASQNIQDFHNLIEVYLDAVFYPRLTPHIFEQEGWHLELENHDKPLSYKGVVFNEMKGAYSSPDSLLAEESIRSLFPDNAYGFDAGGDPKHIPKLTFERFRAFHQRYYHPSNARIYFYGDDDPEEGLRIVNEYLMDFDPIQADSMIRLQPSFRHPKRIVRSFMVGKEEAHSAKGMMTLNWLLPETPDPVTNFSLRMLEYILLGMPASPLRKALIDSGLGEALAGEGLGTELRQLYFSTGLKGIQMNSADRIQTLVIENLAKLVRKRIDPLTVEAAINTVEFRLRENNTGRFPRGLSLMLRALTTWLYEKDPLALLVFEEPLERIKSRVKSDDTLFEKMIDRFFLNNAHHTTLIFQPDPDLREKEEALERNRLAKARSRLRGYQLDGLIENTRELKRLQEKPDPPEALASIPVLKLSDLDKNNKRIPLAHAVLQGTSTLFHDLFTSGIAYLDVGFNIHTLPGRFVPYVPLFGRALIEMGTEMEDFVTLTQRISRKTGGITPQCFTSIVKDTNLGAVWLFLRGKAMLSKMEALTEILRDMLLSVRLDNPERFRQMALEEKARTEQKMVPAGHQVVNLRLRSHFDEAQWAAEQMGGVSYLFFLRELVKAVEENWPEVLAVLKEMHRILVNRNTMILNVTIDGGNWPAFQRHISKLLGALPEGPISQMKWSSEVPACLEGMTIPSQVNFVGKGADLYRLGYRFHGSVLVITRYVRNVWLWDRVRVQGGAYGAFCFFDRFSGVLTFVSYRDPNLIKTLEIFDQTDTFLQETDLSDAELTKSIIGTIGDLDAHKLPDAKGYASLARYLRGDTEDARQEMRDQVLATRRDHFKAFVSMMKKVKENGVAKVLGSHSAIEAANFDRPGWLNVLKVL